MTHFQKDFSIYLLCCKIKCVFLKEKRVKQIIVKNGYSDNLDNVTVFTLHLVVYTLVAYHHFSSGLEHVIRIIIMVFYFIMKAMT